MRILGSILLAYVTITFLSNLRYFAPRSNRRKQAFPRWGQQAQAPARAPRGGAGKVSVLVPVRNEEKNLRACIDSLLAQSYAETEILLMDDHSADSSWQIMNEYAGLHEGRVKAFRSLPLPEGWSGKNWACHQLSQHADGDWLLFTDADTIHGRDSVAYALGELEARHAGLVSYLPELITVTPIEKIVLPVLYLAFYMLFPLALMRRIRDPNAAIAIGTFILMSRELYARVGGHEALRDEIVEDMHLARLVKGAGWGVEFLSGTGLFATRFYTSASEIWEGFTKNSFGAFGYSVFPFILTLVVSYAIFLNPFVQFALAPEISFSNAFFDQVLVIIALRLALAARTRHSLLSVLLHPVMVGFSLGFALNSIWKILRGSPLAWKGRLYKLAK